MPKLLRPRFKATVLAIGLLLAVPTRIAWGDTPASSVISDSGNAVIAIEGDARDNEIQLEQVSETAYRIDDTRGIEARSNCVQLSPTTAECTNSAPAPSITYGANGGQDRATFNVSLPATITAQAGGPVATDGGADRFEIVAGSLARARFSAYMGPDLLVGATAGDFLSGGRGDDRLLGRSGNDRLLGGRGEDVFAGGPGDDRIQANHHDADASIKCGAGDDVAVVDRDLDPEPKGCEKIRLRSGGSS